MGAVEEMAGEDWGYRGDHEAGEVLQGSEGGYVAERADGLDVAPAGGSREVNEEDGRADPGDCPRGGGAVGYYEGGGGGEDHANDEVGAVDGCQGETAGEAVGDCAAQEHADGSGEERQGG